MPRYELNRLGSSEFEGLVQALIKEVIGNGSITFGVGPDGGREATFSGKAPYPSDTENWDGTWIFQAKYHDTELLGTSKCRKELVSDLKSELNKVVNEQQREVDNYIIATNVPLSPAPKSGTLDKLHSVAEEYEASIKNFAVWGADEINKFLDKYPGVRTSYFHLIVAGDLIASLLDERARRKTEVEITIKAYLQGMLRREQNAQLDQAGDVAEHAVKLQQVFFDLHACPNFHNERENEDQSKSFKSVIEYIRSTPQTRTPDGGTRIPVVQMFLGASHLRVVLVGGPGEGKSTVGQYLAQLHRAKLIGDIEKVAISEEYIPSFPRIPFRVILRDFAQWLSESGESGLHKIDGTLDRFICDQVQRVTSRTLAPEVLHDVLKKNPTLLILDGLDEVTDPGLKKEVLERADDFINRADSILDADLQVLATTRPTGYNDQFDPDTYTHLTLVDLEPDQIRGYVTRWIKARDLDDSRASRLDRGIEDCLNDRQIKVLMNTPLQVTILVLIISAGRTPPRQREALFNDYLDVIYKREQGKGSDIITTNKELLVGLHKFIGYELQERATRASATDATLSADDYSRMVSDFITWNDPFSPEDMRGHQLRSITAEAGERLVLIVEPSKNRFGFELRSIQEFFAACHLVDTSQNTDQRYRRFEAIARFPHWQNVALFFAGRVGRNFQGEASNIIEVCKDIDRESPDIYIRRGAHLALTIAFDRAFLPNRRLQRSLLEVALDVLDIDLMPHRLGEIAHALQDMPVEDIKDHIIPILEKKLDTLAPERLSNFLYVVSILDPTSRSAVRAIERMIDNPKTREQAARPLFRIAQFQSNTAALVTKFLNVLDPDQLRSAFSVNEGIHELAQGLATLQRSNVSDEMQYQFLRHAVQLSSHGFRGRYGRSLVSDNGKDWNLDGADLVLRAIKAVFHCTMMTDVRRRRISSEGLTESLEEIQDTIPGFIIRGDLRDFCRKSGLSEDDSLVAPFWILHLWLGEVTAESIPGALRFFSIKKSDSLVTNMLAIDWSVVPTFDYIRSRLAASVEVNSLADQMAKWSGLKGFHRWMAFRAEVLSFADSVRRIHRRVTLSTPNEPTASMPPRMMATFSALQEEAGDPHLFFYAAVDIHRRSLAVLSMFGDRHNQISEVMSSGYLTSATHSVVNAISRDSGNDKLSTFETRVTLVAELLELEGANEPDLLNSVLVSCFEFGIPDTDLVERALAKFGQPRAGIPFISVWTGKSTKSLYELMLTLATKHPDSDVARGACRIIQGTAMVTLFGSASPNPPRFAGLAKMHRALCLDEDPEKRMAAAGLFAIRKNWPDSSVQWIRRLFVACSTEQEVQMLIRLVHMDTQIQENRVALWTEILTSLLPIDLYGDLTLQVRESLGRLLQTTNQSLQTTQHELGLPLAPIG